MQLHGITLEMIKVTTMENFKQLSKDQQDSILDLASILHNFITIKVPNHLDKLIILINDEAQKDKSLPNSDQV